MTALTKKASNPFKWTERASHAFDRLKQLFTSTPILTLPDPKLPFVVEVDASGIGVGAVLLQRARSDHKLHPCAYFSRRLSPAERNYDIGNRELLAVKLPLEEWRQWLEGAKHPFLIWTDHRNLTYISEAKRLSSRQTCWALFWALFLTALTLLSHTGQVLRTQSLMPSQGSLIHQKWRANLNQSYPAPEWWHQFSGESKPR